MKRLRVLVGCEYSGRVRDAFTACGHFAVSCDLLPSESPGIHHQGDVREILNDGWDIFICHPTCTYLCSSGIHWNTRRPERALLTEEAVEFAKLLLAAPVPFIAMENPIGVLSTRIRKPEQIIQPWQFGHAESKATCLWLKNLPPLVPSAILPLPASGRWENQTASGQNKLPPSEDRGKIRSLTYQGIADAMAAQWGHFVATH